MSEQPPAIPPAIRTVAMPADANASGDIFGGWLMSQMDLAGGNVAILRARGRCVTLAVEAISFLRPVLIGDEVSLYAELVSDGRTSMRIHVEAWRRARSSPEMQRVTDAVFTFVALDETARPRPLPVIDPGVDV